LDPAIITKAKKHFAAVDPVLAELAVRYPDCRPQIAAGTPFAVLCQSIVSQQLSNKVADVIWARLVDRLGGDVTPGRLQATDDTVLRACGLSRPKVRYARCLADFFADGRVNPESFPALDDTAVVAQLTAVPGIGEWTAHMYLIFGLGRPDVLPVGDLGLRKAVRLQYSLAALPDADTLTSLGEKWRPYRSVATLFLWRSLDGV